MRRLNFQMFVVLLIISITNLFAQSLPLEKISIQGTSFLEDEAGISAYMNSGQTIDLALAKQAYRTIEDETDQYIIGSVQLTGYSETEDIHAYTHKDGWIVTYYLKDEPSAKILDWNNYSEDETIRGTKLEIGIVKICDFAGLAVEGYKILSF